MYIDDIKKYLSQLENRIEDKIYLGDVTSFNIADGNSSNNAIQITFILGAYKFSYNIVLNNNTVKILGYVDNSAKLSYDGTNDYTLSNNAIQDASYIAKIIEYHLLTFFGKTVTDVYKDIIYNDKVVIMEKKMFVNKKVKVILEKKVKDNAETDDMKLVIQDMFMFFLDKPILSRQQRLYTETENEEIYLVKTVEDMMKKDEFTDFFDKGFGDTTFINTNLTQSIIDIILDNLASDYGFNKDRFKEVYSTYRTEVERKTFEKEVNTKMTKLLSLAFDYDNGTEVIEGK